MGLIIFKIVFIVLLIRILFLIFTNCMILFNNQTNKEILKQVKENPDKFIYGVFSDKLVDDIFWAAIFILLLISAFSGNVTIS